jgi:hypothetical protein
MGLRKIFLEPGQERSQLRGARRSKHEPSEVFFSALLGKAVSPKFATRSRVILDERMDAHEGRKSRKQKEHWITAFAAMTTGRR